MKQTWNFDLALKEAYVIDNVLYDNKQDNCIDRLAMLIK